MAVRTGRDYLARALRIINAINVGEVPDDEEANDGIALFNDMLGLWATQSLTIPYTASAEFPTVAGQKVYSIGPGAQWDGNRPINIHDAYIRINNGGGPLDIPIDVLSLHQYGRIPLKDIASTQSQALYYENQFPIAKITLYPVPSAVFGVVITYDTLFAAVTLDSDLSGMPPGYALAIQYNLAKYLAVEYNKEWVAGSARDNIAKESLGNIKSANIHAPDAEFDSAIPGVGGGRRWDWRTGDYRRG